MTEHRMSSKDLHTCCDVCDARIAKFVLSPARGVRFAVCGSCATESRRDGIDLDAFHPAPEGEEAECR